MRIKLSKLKNKNYNNDNIRLNKIISENKSFDDIIKYCESIIEQNNKEILKYEKRIEIDLSTIHEMSDKLMNNDYKKIVIDEYIPRKTINKSIKYMNQHYDEHVDEIDKIDDKINEIQLKIYLIKTDLKKCYISMKYFNDLISSMNMSSLIDIDDLITNDLITNNLITNDSINNNNTIANNLITNIRSQMEILQSTINLYESNILTLEIEKLENEISIAEINHMMLPCLIRINEYKKYDTYMDINKCFLDDEYLNDLL